MPWLKSEGKFPKNDKVWELSDAAYRLYDAGRHYATEHLTDGHVPSSRISALTPKPPTQAQIAALMRARLWHLLPDICDSCVEMRKKRHAMPLPKSGYIVHDYLVYNPSRAEYEAEQERLKKAGRAGAAKRWGSGGGMASAMADAMAPAMAGAMADANAEGPESDSSSHSSRNGPYPVSRTPVPGAIAPVTPRARDHEDAARSGSQVRTGLRDIAPAVARIRDDVLGRTREPRPVR